MTDYVAQQAQRLIYGDAPAPVTAAFRKFVSQILTSTRLPSTTILLGMNYLSRKVNMVKEQHHIEGTTWKTSDGLVWRMLTIGLLLGSKFLDDNTFQNRSWAEVSGIAVTELNNMELDWLKSLKWNMYVNLDMSADFKAWLRDWDVWREAKNVQRKATLDRLAPLAPIDTNVLRTQPYQQPYNAYVKSASSERPLSGSLSAMDYYSQRGQELANAQAHAAWSGNLNNTPLLTTPSDPDSGYSTPEYASATGGNPRFNDWQYYSRGYQQQAQSYAPYVAPRVANYQTPIHNQHSGYGSAWDWNMTAGDCPCCPPSKQPYNMTNGYMGQQQQITA